MVSLVFHGHSPIQETCLCSEQKSFWPNELTSGTFLVQHSQKETSYPAFGIPINMPALWDFIVRSLGASTAADRNGRLWFIPSGLAGKPGARTMDRTGAHSGIRTPDSLVATRQTKLPRSCQTRRQARGIRKLAEQRDNTGLLQISPIFVQFPRIFPDLYHILTRSAGAANRLSSGGRYKSRPRSCNTRSGGSRAVQRAGACDSI